MAVLVEGISIIFKASSIMDKYPGGWKSFKAEVPNKTLCADGELIRIGFMSPDDVKAFIEDLTDYGIIYLKKGKSHDLVVVDQLYGFTSDCDWAEFGTIDWDGDPKKEISACRIKDSKIDQVITPEDWEYEKSLSKNYKFIQTEKKNEKVVFLRHEDGVDVYHIPSFGI